MTKRLWTLSAVLVALLMLATPTQAATERSSTSTSPAATTREGLRQPGHAGPAHVVTAPPSLAVPPAAPAGPPPPRGRAPLGTVSAFHGTGGGLATSQSEVTPGVTPASSSMSLLASSSVANGGHGTSVSEPSVAQSGSVIFETGSLFASVSLDSGATWTYLNPLTALPAPTNMQVCCQQRAIYDPTHDLFVWVLQYYNTAVNEGPNVERVAIARGGLGVKNGNWTYFDIAPDQIDSSLAGDWLDYPYLALSPSFLYLSTNVYNGNIWVDSEMLRFSLGDLAQLTAGAHPLFDNYFSRSAFNFTAVQDSGSTMYFASNQFCDPGNGSIDWMNQPSVCIDGLGQYFVNRIRIYAWVDGQSTPAVHFLSTSNVPYGPSTCNPGGTEFCTLDDHRIQDGFVAGNKVGFVFDAAQSTASSALAAHPHPFIEVVRVPAGAICSNWMCVTPNQNDEPSITSSSGSWAYGSIAANSRGDLGMGGSFVVPGAGAAPSFYVAGLDAGTSGWGTPILVGTAGTGTPTDNHFGDFQTVRTAFPWSNVFIATGYVLTGSGCAQGSYCASASTRYARFGRASDLAGGQIIPVNPTRIMDTRAGSQVGPFNTPIGAGQTRSLNVLGVGPIPSSHVVGVILEVGVTDTSTYSYLTVFPGNTTAPVASNLNWSPGLTLANLVEVAVGSNGAISYFNANGTVDVFFDVVGFVTTDTATYSHQGLYNPFAPVRYLDTRTTLGGHLGRLGPGQSLTLQVAGVIPAGSGLASAPVPGSGNASASAVLLNLTAVGLTGAPGTYLSVYPSDAPSSTPLTTSNLNISAGDTRPNRVAVKLGANGAIKIFNSQGYIDVIADLSGWLSSSSVTTGTLFHTQAPLRILDTRPSSKVGTLTTFGANVQKAQNITYLAGIPAGATAVALNVTITSPTSGSFLSVAPSFPTSPSTSDLNWPANDTRANDVIVQINGPNGSPGTVAIYNNLGSVDVIVDVVGWFGTP